MVSSDFLHTQLSFSVFFCAQLSGNYLKIAFFFQKMGAKIGFFNFLCFKLIFGKFSFLGLLKHYKNRGFSRFLCFLFLKKKKGKKKMITGIYEFGFFWSKNGRFVTHNFFPKKIAWKPYFYSVLGCAFSGPRCQKRQFLDTLSKKKENFDW